MTRPTDEPAFEDLTARARIRDAAMRLFAEKGVEGTTVRDIAAAAQVSPGLLRHHFGSKDGLRDACDAYALDRILRLDEQAILENRIADPAFFNAMQPTLLPIMRYIARSMVDGSEAAAGFFEAMVEQTEQWITAHHPDVTPVDLRAYAAVTVAYGLGPLVLHGPLSRALGADILTNEGMLRMSRGAIDVNTYRLIDPARAAQVHAAIDQLEGRRPTTTQDPPRAGEGTTP